MSRAAPLSGYTRVNKYRSSTEASSAGGCRPRSIPQAASRGERALSNRCAKSRRGSYAPTTTSIPARRASSAAFSPRLTAFAWHRVVRADGSPPKGAPQRELPLREGVPNARRPPISPISGSTSEMSIVKGQVTAVGLMAYAQVAGQISPAGAETAKSGANPALSRNCDAPPSGMSQVDRSAPNGRQPSEEGRFVRQPPPGLFLRRRGGFS